MSSNREKGIKRKQNVELASSRQNIISNTALSTCVNFKRWRSTFSTCNCCASEHQDTLDCYFAPQVVPSFTQRKHKHTVSKFKIKN